jgi:hypothetical protein
MYKEQLMALGIVPGDQDLAAKSFADLKAELNKEKATRVTAQTEVDTLTRAAKDLKINADKFDCKYPHLKTRSNI